MNVLITCCFRDFIHGTVECLRSAYPDVRVIGCDCRIPPVVLDDDFECVYEVGSCYEDCYIDEIIGICLKENIDVVIPIHTMEIECFYKNSQKFKNAKIGMVMCDKAIEVLNHKDVFYSFLSKNGFNVVDWTCVDTIGEFEHFMNGKDKSKYIVKNPECKSFMKAQNVDDITGKTIVQEFIDGDEYTVDCFCIDGDMIYDCCKLNTKMGGGTAVESEIIRDDKVVDVCRSICSDLRLSGNVGFDLIKTNNGNVYVIDCNPRLTATISLSCKSGINFVQCGIEYALGHEVPAFKKNNKIFGIVRKRMDLFYER